MFLIFGGLVSSNHALHILEFSEELRDAVMNETVVSLS